MKKILFFIILLFMVSHGQALEYTDYSDFSDFTDEYIKSDDLTDVKVERRYKYYRLDKILGNYGESTQQYPFIDKEDFIYDEFTDFSLEKPNEQENRIIETKERFHYNKLKDISYLKIAASKGNTTFSGFTFRYNNEKINFNSNLGNSFTLTPGKEVIITFNQKLDLNLLRVSFTIKEANNGYISFTLFSGDNNTDYAQVQLNNISSTTFSWEGKYSSPTNQNYFEDYYSDTKLIQNDILRFLGNDTFYRYKNPIYRTYNIVRNYYNEYLTEPYENYIYKDKDLYKDYYAKRVRSIKDENTLTPVIMNNSLKNKNEVTDSDVIYTKQSLNSRISQNKILHKENMTQDDTNNHKLLYISFPWLIITVILFLVLSKQYKKKKRYAKV